MLELDGLCGIRLKLIFCFVFISANKKPFWVSHLKLAESREIELNSYVQRLLKLPTKVSFYMLRFVALRVLICLHKRYHTASWC